MSCFLAALACLLGGAVISAVAAGRPRLAHAAFLCGLYSGCGLGLVQVAVACGSASAPAIRFAWAVPKAELALAVDPLSSFFLLLVFGVCLVAGIFGEDYVESSPALARKPAIRPFFLLLIASLATVVCARNAILFLGAWEIMALASFFLIISEHEHEEARRAGILYFICTRVATLSLFVLFALLGSAAGTLDFDGIRAAVPGVRLSATLLPLALLGFGVKAGFAPLHIWLQEAHPAAPSHVSALMSGVVIKIGVYGFLRLIWLAGAVPQSWGVALLAVGAVSGIGGVLFALAQHDLKRLLAYHSVENIGIIALGMGLGCLGLAHHRPELALIGFTGAILHVLNHGIFKSLLFLGSGAFHRALGTRDIESAGGLLRRMPLTSVASLIGAAAISGIPPLNGFVSEWLIYTASFRPGPIGDARLATVAAAALALIGGLALACFTKAYGALCLGEPRTEAAAKAEDPGPGMIVPMGLLAAACVWIGLCPGPATLFAGRAAASLCGYAPESAEPILASAIGGVRLIGALAAATVALAAGLALWRSRLLGERVAWGPTWGCGFTAVSARLQYSASSFAQPITRFFAPVLATDVHYHAPSGYWPTEASFSSHTEDRVLDGTLLPAAGLIGAGVAWLKRKWQGRLQYYMLYVAIFLIAVLVWVL